MKKAFPIGSLDKTKRFIKTESGWVSVKKAAMGDIAKLHDILEDAQTPSALVPKLLVTDSYKVKQPGFSSIYEAQVAWLKKEITHKEYLNEQALMYGAGVISKEHRSIKMK